MQLFASVTRTDVALHNLVVRSRTDPIHVNTCKGHGRNMKSGPASKATAKPKATPKRAAKAAASRKRKSEGK